MAKRWTDDDDFRLTEMRDEGVSYKRIGIQLGRSEHACAQRGFKLGITKKRSGSLPIDLPTYIDDETKPKVGVPPAPEAYIRYTPGVTPETYLYRNDIEASYPLDLDHTFLKPKPTLLKRIIHKLFGR
jgi:hypothetical protein